MRWTWLTFGWFLGCAAQVQSGEKPELSSAAGNHATAGSGERPAAAAGVGGAGAAGKASIDRGGGGALGDSGHASGGAGTSIAGQGGALVAAGGAPLAGTTSMMAGMANAGGQPSGGAAACTLAGALAGIPIFDAEQLNAAGNDYLQTTASGFFLYSDLQHVGTVTPPAAMPVLGVMPGHAGNLFRSTGMALAADFWGVGVGFWVSPCLNVTPITGVSFWLRSDYRR